jgi:hypothetical protein
MEDSGFSELECAVNDSAEDADRIESTDVGEDGNHVSASLGPAEEEQRNVTDLDTREEQSFAECVISPGEEEEEIFLTPLRNAQIPSDRLKSQRWSESEIEEYADLFMRKGSVPVEQYRVVVLQSIQRKCTHAAMEGDYDTAAKYTKVIQKYLEACHEAERTDERTVKLNNINHEIDLVEARLKESAERWKDLKHGVSRNFSRQIAYQRFQQKEQLAEFEKKWDDPSCMRKFSKPSRALLALRQSERKLVVARMFTDARAVRTLADIQQEEETAKAEREQYLAMKKERKCFTTAQLADMEKLKRYQQRSISEMDTKERIEASPFEARIATLTVRKEWLNNQRPSTACRILPVPGDQVIGVRSPRTRMQFCNWRKNPMVKMLPLKSYSECRKRPRTRKKAEREDIESCE